MARSQAEHFFLGFRNTLHLHSFTFLALTGIDARLSALPFVVAAAILGNWVLLQVHTRTLNISALNVYRPVSCLAICIPY